MADKYKYNHEGVTTFISSLKEKTSQYNDKIVELTRLINTIDTSPAWIDLDVKSSFVETCNSYITIYNNLIVTMEIYINYLTKKSEIANNIETKYAGGNR